MSEVIATEKLCGLDRLPLANSQDVDTARIEWQASATEGFWLKQLLTDQPAGLRTWWMKVDAQAFSPMHAHDEIEQIYVLEGSLYDQDKTYGPGTYIVRAARAMHTTGSEDGALSLLFYSATDE